MLRRPSQSLAAAAVAALSLLWVWNVAFHTSFGRWIDGAVLQGFIGLRSDRTAPLADAIARLCDPGSFAVLGGSLVCIALVRRRLRLALAVAVMLPLANLTTQVLKPTLAAPRAHEFLDYGQIADAAWPSGHTTAAMTLALGLVLVSAPRWRPLAAAVGGLFAAVVPFSIMTLGWHYPSDVLGGYGIAAIFTCLAIAALRATEPQRGVALSPSLKPEVEARRELGPTIAAAIAACGLFALVGLARPAGVAAYFEAHTTFFFGAAALGALALAIAASLALLLRAERPVAGR